jgi:hypothetical protein
MSWHDHDGNGTEKDDMCIFMLIGVKVYMSL